MRTYLVTGGAGFIGSNYIHYMFRKYDNEIRIINVDALTYAGNLENLKDIENRDNYTFVKANICDKEAIAKIFAENDIDRVVHFAAESHVDRSIRNPEVFVQTNVLGTAVMLNCAKNAWELPDGTFKPGKKFLHVSTDEVYFYIFINFHCYHRLLSLPWKRSYTSVATCVLQDEELPLLLLHPHRRSRRERGLALLLLPNTQEHPFRNPYESQPALRILAYLGKS